MMGNSITSSKNNNNKDIYVLALIDVVLKILMFDGFGSIFSNLLIFLENRSHLYFCTVQKTTITHQHGLL